MNVKIICVGKLKERFYEDAVKEFMKRLSRYGTFEIVEVADEKAGEQLSPMQKIQVKRTEGEKILSHIQSGEYLIATAIDGKMLSSEELSCKMGDIMLSGKSRICIVIGGSLGLSDEVLSRADFKLSFGKATFSHQIFRIMLLEQLYRCFRIMNNEPYHK
ncbi:MAG: 23S rRNA (pseudouridine(1915)-N(3))-methyltransferase RlmH [Clostridia bacterium]|nr:23S rRNA (pseudouridine(1915)-N(3))-methyltransferase RlmH [Clostridia bacterium]